MEAVEEEPGVAAQEVLETFLVEKERVSLADSLPALATGLSVSDHQMMRRIKESSRGSKRRGSLKGIKTRP